MRIIFTFLASLWIVKVFVFSLPYKFALHPTTQNIFGTIGAWIGNISETLGSLFSSYGAYIIGSFELTASVFLMLPFVFRFFCYFKGISYPDSSKIIGIIGGILASSLMTGAVFFHLFTPLGVEVYYNDVSDNGSLFYSALSILFLGFIIAYLHKKS